MHALIPCNCPDVVSWASAGHSIYQWYHCLPDPYPTRIDSAPWLEDFVRFPQDKAQLSQLAETSAGVSCSWKHLSFSNVKETGWLNSADNVMVYSFAVNHLGSLIWIVCDLLIALSQHGDCRDSIGGTLNLKKEQGNYKRSLQRLVETWQFCSLGRCCVRGEGMVLIWRTVPWFYDLKLTECFRAANFLPGCAKPRHWKAEEL